MDESQTNKVIRKQNQRVSIRVRELEEDDLRGRTTLLKMRGRRADLKGYIETQADLA